MLIKICEQKNGKVFYEYESSVCPRIGEQVSKLCENNYYATDPIRSIRHVVKDNKLEYILVYTGNI